MKSSRRSNRAGQSLVEFAVVSLVLYMLLAAILTFGHMLYVAQGLQGAADLAAREISRTPFHAMHPSASPARTLTWDDVSTTSVGFNDNDKFRRAIFDEAFLVIDLDEFYEKFPSPPDPPISIFRHLAPTLPLLNQQLIPLMIVDTPTIDGVKGRFLRYPGALLNRSGSAITPPRGIVLSEQGPYESESKYSSWVKSSLNVEIPLVVGSAGNESVQWLKVMEEIKPLGANSPFSIDQKGIVALRMNYPFQSASMSSFQPNPNGTFAEKPFVEPNSAVDGNFPPPDGNTLTDAGLEVVLPDGKTVVYTGTYGGKYGLGAQGAFGQIVRPFRRVISAQAIYRREIFE